MDFLSHLKDNQEIFFNYMKSKYPVIYKSNLFLRDLQYGIKGYFKMKGYEVRTMEAEMLAYKFAEFLENKENLILIANNTWKVNFLIDKPVIHTNEG